MKKVLLVLLAMMMALLLAACGSNDPGSPSTPSQTGTPSSPSTGTPSSSTPTTPSGEPAAPTGPEGQTYGGMVRLVTSGTNVPYGVVYHYPNSFRPSVPYAQALMLETPQGDLIPYLCTAWEADPEKNEIRFTLREDVTFSDGSPFNAEVVAWHVDKWLENGVVDRTILGAEVRGEFEVAFIMSAYGNWAPTILAARVCAYISVENYEKNGVDYAEQNPTGTGGFLLEDWVPGLSARWVRRDDYWEPGKPYLDAVEYITMTDIMTQNAAMISKGPDAIDILQTSNPEQVAALVEMADIYLSGRPLGPLCLFPSSNNPDSPLAIREVRKAIYYALDREAIVAARGFGVWTPAPQLIPPGYPGHLPASREPDYDPDRSRTLLAEAGFPNGLNMTLYSPASVDRDAITAVQDMLREVGINIELEFPEAGLAVELRTKGWEGLYAGGVNPLSNVAHSLFYYYDPEYINYPSLWRAEALTPLYYQARSTRTVEDGPMLAYHQVLMDETILIPIYNTYTNFVLKSDLQGGGFAAYGAGVEWIPEDVWKLQN